MVFEGTTEVYKRIYRFNSKWVTKKEKHANLNWIRRILCLHSNLSNDNVISAKGQALVIQSLDSAIQQINLYPVDSAFSFPIT